MPLFPWHPTLDTFPMEHSQRSMKPVQFAAASQSDALRETARCASHLSSYPACALHTNSYAPARRGGPAFVSRPAAAPFSSARQSLCRAAPIPRASVSLSLSPNTPAPVRPNASAFPRPSHRHWSKTPAPTPYTPNSPPDTRAPENLANNSSVSSVLPDRPSTTQFPAACSAPDRRAAPALSPRAPPLRSGLARRPPLSPAPSPRDRSRAPVRSRSTAPRASAKQFPPAQ